MSPFLPLLLALACPPPAPKTIVIGIDMSGSITRGQLEAWLPAATKVIDVLEPGQTFILFAIDGQTTNSRPFLIERLPTRPKPGAGRDALAKFKREWRAGLDRITDHIKAILTKKTYSRDTDILGLIERVRSRPERPIAIVLFTDSIHSTPELEMANRFGLAAATVSTKVSAKLGWGAPALANLGLFFVLTTENPSSNPRPQLRAFWDSLLKTGGGALCRFETDWE